MSTRVSLPSDATSCCPAAVLHVQYNDLGPTSHKAMHQCSCQPMFPASHRAQIHACRFEKADELKRDLKKAQALEKAYKKGKDGDKDADKEDESSSEEDEDKIAEEKEAGVRTGSAQIESSRACVHA